MTARTAGPDAGLLAALRLGGRMVRRELRRQLRQQWLVVVLIAIPVAVGAWSTIAQRTVLDTPVTEAEAYGVGDADTMLEIRLAAWADTEAVEPVGVRELAAPVLAALEAEADDVLATWRVYEIDAPVPFYRVVGADWQGPLAESAFLTVDGRLPTRPGEIALSRTAAGRLDAEVGDRIETIDGSEAEVVAVVRPHASSALSTVYVPAESLINWVDDLGPEMGVGVTIGLRGLSPERAMAIANGAAPSALAGGVSSAPVVADETFAARDETFFARDGRRRAWWIDPPASVIEPGRRPWQAGTLVTAALLVEAALLSAAAFVIRGRRRTAEVGRLAALGATPRQIELVLLVEAAVVGLVGALVGLVAAVVFARWNVELLVRAGFELGAGAANATTPIVRPVDLVVPGLVAVTAAVGSAWLPARRAARVRPRDAMADATSQAPLRRGWAWRGLAMLGGAGLLLALSNSLADGRTSNRENAAAVLAVAGLALVLGAVLIFGSAALAGLGRRPGSGLPLGLRLGIRQLARHRTRSVVVVGAGAVIAVAAIAGYIMSSLSGDYVVAEGATRARVYHQGPDRWLDVGHLALPDPAPDHGDRSNVGGVGDAPAALSEVSVNVGYERWAQVSKISGPSLPGPVNGRLVVATPELVAAAGLDDEMIDALNESNTLVLVDGRDEWFWPVDDLASGLWAPFEVVVVERDDLAELGIRSLIAPADIPADAEVREGDGRWLIASDDGFTRSEREWMASANVSIPGEVVLGSPDRTPQLVGLAVVVSLLLVIARVAAALIAVESDGDTRIMVAVGGPRWARQRFLGAQLLVQVALAVGLAVPIGLALGWFLVAISSNNLAWRPVVPAYLVGGLALTPLLAATLVVLTTRSAPAAVSRRLT